MSTARIALHPALSQLRDEIPSNVSSRTRHYNQFSALLVHISSRTNSLSVMCFHLMIGISELTYESCDNNKLGAGAIGLRTF